MSDLFDLIVVENMNNLQQRQQHQQRVMTTSFRTSSNGSGAQGEPTDSGDRRTDGPTRGDCLALLANMCCRLSRLNLLNEPQTLRQTTQATATGGTYHQEKGVDNGRVWEGKDARANLNIVELLAAKAKRRPSRVRRRQARPKVCLL